MRRIALSSIVLLLVFAGLAHTDGEKKSIKWLAKLDDGLKAAKEAKKPVFVDFSADW